MSDNISNSTLTESLNAESIINSDDDEFVNDTDTSTVVGDDELLSDTDSDIETKVESKQGEEKFEQHENSKNCQTNKIICGICYKDLYVGNSVTTICNHSFCNTCFFRWMEVNTQCPLCRAPVDSKTNLTDEQLQKEHSEVYQDYVKYLYENSMLFREHQLISCSISKKKNEYNHLKSSTDSLIQRQIRLREMIENTRGYNEGQLAAFHNSKTNSDKQEYSSIIFETMRKNIHFMHGFMNGLQNENERLIVFKEIILNKLSEGHNSLDFSNN